MNNLIEKENQILLILSGLNSADAKNILSNIISNLDNISTVNESFENSSISQPLRSISQSLGVGQVLLQKD